MLNDIQALRIGTH